MILAGAFINWHAHGGWSTVILSVVSLMVGGWMLRSPSLTGQALLLLIASWAMLSGVLEALLASGLPSRASTGLLGTGGVLSAVVGVALLLWPSIALTTVAVLMGISTLVGGVLTLTLSWRIRAECLSWDLKSPMSARE